MSDVADLVTAIRQLITTQGVRYQSATDVSDVYEAFVFALVVDTASRHGAHVRYENVDEKPTTDLVFRTSPGHIYSKRRPYTHAVVEFAGALPLEVHLGVRVQGTSGVLHECDVLVLPREEAQLSRRQQIAPRGSACVLVIECKYYTGHLGLEQARNFEGVRIDVSTRSELFVANTGAPSVVRYLNARDRPFERDVLPGSPRAIYVQSEVRRALKKYLNKTSPSVII